MRPKLSSLACIFLVLLLGAGCSSQKDPEAEFVKLMNAGKVQFEAGQSAAAIEAFEKSVAMDASSLEAKLNLAMAYLKAGKAEEALRVSGEALKLDATSAAALYISGCANLRLGRPEPASRLLRQVKDIDRTINAVSYQLGRAHQEMGQFEEALRQFQEVVEFEPEHVAAHYSLSQVLLRLNRQEEATRSIQKHQQVLASRQNQPNDPFIVEKCVYTTARAPFILEQPQNPGIKVSFVDATSTSFGGLGTNWQGPVAVLEINHRGTNDLLVREGRTGFRLLMQSNGVFSPKGNAIPVPATNNYARILVGDVDNDRNEDVIVLGENQSHVIRFSTNGVMRETTQFIGLRNLRSTEGVLLDLDFTGKLDLMTTIPGTNNVRVHRNLGNLFTERGVTSGPPATLQGVARIVTDDWNNDDLPDLWLLMKEGAPRLLLKQRGGGYAMTNSVLDLPPAQALAVGDVNNDLHSDLVLLSGGACLVVDGNSSVKQAIQSQGLGEFREIRLVDYDNDGWLDILIWGNGARIWRNLGKAGFKELTTETGIASMNGARIENIQFADLDSDGDSDLLAVISGGGLRLFKNEGGNANHQLRLRLLGNRSNASGLGHRIELVSGGLRAMRFIRELPVEIGVGKHRQLETLTVKWSDLAPPIVDVPVSSTSVIPIVELQSPTGSCPYLYVWDGTRYRFVTDLLGAAPVGLPVAEGRYIESDPVEWVLIGNDSNFKPLQGNYSVKITEELREVLYLDEALLAVVDHDPATEVHPTNKLLPGKPFPTAELMTVGNRKPLLFAKNLAGQEVTDRLQEIDGNRVSPLALRDPQMRGLAEPHGVELDFGELDRMTNPVLVLTGWLRFGGGMANMSGSRHGDFPFPFPQLEVQAEDGTWGKVQVQVGAPAGKTKTILVELTGKLPPKSRRLRLIAAFEIHWDRIAMFEKNDGKNTRITRIRPGSANLGWRGFSEFEPAPWHQPLTPDYSRVRQRPEWRLALTGWCTAYGDVRELLESRDEALVLVNGGDELSLTFGADGMPPKPAGKVRDYFLYTDGWDKDADFHVRLGSTVDPLPFHGMDDQLYGIQKRPAFERDQLMQRSRTRWVGPWALPRAEQARK